jgi:hypothetical protein
MSEPHYCPASLPFFLSHPGRCHRAPPHLGPACQSRSHPVASIAHSSCAPLFVWQQRHPCLTVGGCCWLPQSAHRRAKAPPLILLPPPRRHAHRAPFAFSFWPRATEPLFKSASRRPVPISPRSPLVHARATGAERQLPEPAFPVALLSTGAPSSIGIWPASPLSYLSSVSHPSSLSSPNPWPSLTSLSL